MTPKGKKSFSYKKWINIFLALLWKVIKKILLNIFGITEKIDFRVGIENTFWIHYALAILCS